MESAPRPLVLALLLAASCGAEAARLGGADLYCGSAPPLCSTVPRDAAGAYLYSGYIRSSHHNLERDALP